METKSLEDKIDRLQTSIDTLALIEFCKLGAKRDQVRDVFGTLDNNLFAKVNKIINPKDKK